MLFFWTLFSSKNPEKWNVLQFSQNYEAAKYSSQKYFEATFFNIDNQKCYLSSKSVYENDFWRSCDTEDWSNDAENTAAHHSNKLHFKVYSNGKVILNQLF